MANVKQPPQDENSVSPYFTLHELANLIKDCKPSIAGSVTAKSLFDAAVIQDNLYRILDKVGDLDYDKFKSALCAPGGGRRPDGTIKKDCTHPRLIMATTALMYSYYSGNFKELKSKIKDSFAQGREDAFIREFLKLFGKKRDGKTKDTEWYYDCVDEFIPPDYNGDDIYDKVYSVIISAVVFSFYYVFTGKVNKTKYSYESFTELFGTSTASDYYKDALSDFGYDAPGAIKLNPKQHDIKAPDAYKIERDAATECKKLISLILRVKRPHPETAATVNTAEYVNFFRLMCGYNSIRLTEKDEKKIIEASANNVAVESLFYDMFLQDIITRDLYDSLMLKEMMKEYNRGDVTESFTEIHFKALSKTLKYVNLIKNDERT